MLTRRTFLKQTGMATSGILLTGCQGISSSSPAASQALTSESEDTQGNNPATENDATAQSDVWRMPDEAEAHKRTWMAFGASEEIWGAELLSVVRQNLADIALAIAKFEPVTMLVRESELEIAQGLMDDKVTFVVATMDDFWMRDTGPVFVSNGQGKMGCIDFHFNGWGDKQAHAQDAKVAGFIASQAGFEVLPTNLVLEGGGIEVDGQGTAIITESCVLNANRNPNVTKEECEAELKALLGLKKIIWLPGIAGKEITDGHTDFYARFAAPGVVVAGYDPDPKSFDHAVTEKHLEILNAATDAEGRALKVVVIEGPGTIRPDYENDDFAAGYINFYVCNGGVIMAQFGDAEADQAAKDALQKAFPEHEIVQLNVDGVAAGGGGIHCTTQQEPALRSTVYLPVISG